MSGGVWDHVMVNRGVYAIRHDRTEVAMLSLVADSPHEPDLVRAVVASFADVHGGRLADRSAALVGTTTVRLYEHGDRVEQAAFLRRLADVLVAEVAEAGR